MPDWNPNLAWEFMRLIEAAKQFDAATGQPDCEDPEKAVLLEKIQKIAQE